MKIKYYVKLYSATLPYQVVPLFGVKKDHISVALAVVVLTGIVLLGHLTATGQVIDLPAVASLDIYQLLPAIGASYSPDFSYAMNIKKNSRFGGGGTNDFLLVGRFIFLVVLMTFLIHLKSSRSILTSSSKYLSS